MNEGIVLFGAGGAGRYALQHLRSQGREPLCFVDSDPAKWGTKIDGVDVHEPAKGSRDAIWVATAIHRPAAVEIRAEIARLGVKSKPLWECLPVCHGLPKDAEWLRRMLAQIDDLESREEILSQKEFRERPNYDCQRPPSDIRDIYFPDFIAHRDDEHFCDLGACDGDTVEAFLRRWPKYARISAVEPDRENFLKLEEFCRDKSHVSLYYGAVGDRSEMVPFVSNGDFSSRLAANGESSVPCNRLDDMDLASPPTYIKMDIEGAELEAIWGARRTLKEHSPVLAICAYHASDHFWKIPLLIHAIQPDYSLLLRRYAEGAYEIVWYGVPKERVR